MSDNNADESPRPDTPREAPTADDRPQTDTSGAETRDDQPASAFDTDGGATTEPQTDSRQEAAADALSDSDGKPDPSEVEPLDREEHLHQRDEHGKLISEPDAIQVNGEWRRVEHKPSTKGLMNRIETHFEGFDESGTAIDMGKIDELLSDYYTLPDYSAEEYDDVDPALYRSLMFNMVNTVMSGFDDDDVANQLQEEIESRQSDAGN